MVQFATVQSVYGFLVMCQSRRCSYPNWPKVTCTLLCPLYLPPCTPVLSKYQEWKPVEVNSSSGKVISTGYIWLTCLWYIRLTCLWSIRLTCLCYIRLTCLCYIRLTCLCKILQCRMLVVWILSYTFCSGSTAAPIHHSWQQCLPLLGWRLCDLDMWYWLQRCRKDGVEFTFKLRPSLAVSVPGLLSLPPLPFPSPCLPPCHSFSLSLSSPPSLSPSLPLALPPSLSPSLSPTLSPTPLRLWMYQYCGVSASLPTSCYVWFYRWSDTVSLAGIVMVGSRCEVLAAIHVRRRDICKYSITSCCSIFLSGFITTALFGWCRHKYGVVLSTVLATLAFRCWYLKTADSRCTWMIHNHAVMLCLT